MAHGAGARTQTWESPFTPDMTPYLGLGNHGFLHYLDTGAIAVGEQHMVVFWARVPATRRFLMGLA